MLCTLKRNNRREGDDIKDSFLTLARMGFQMDDAILIIGIDRKRIIHWLKTDLDFCTAIKNLPSFKQAYGG